MLLKWEGGFAFKREAHEDAVKGIQGMLLQTDSSMKWVDKNTPCGWVEDKNNRMGVGTIKTESQSSQDDERNSSQKGMKGSWVTFHLFRARKKMKN